MFSGIGQYLVRRRWALLGWSLAIAVVYGGATWAGLRAGDLLMRDQPSIRDLEHHQFSLSSKVYDASGELIYTFAQERRDYVAYEDMSPWLIQGLVAVEDEQFWEHHGLNYQGILRAAIRDIEASLEAGRLVFPEGGSSLTQQLAKQLMLTPEKTLARKAQEAVLALHVEKTFSKEEILELYLNHVFLGHQRHGVEAAAQYYFGTSAAELDLAQAALLAGLPQRPSAYSPRRNPEAAIARRNHVLDRMVEAGYITPREAADAKAGPLELATSEAQRRIRTQQAAPYFVEDIRRQLVEEYGDLVNTGGLEIETTIDMEMQREATRAVRDGLRRLDKELNGFRPIETNVLDDGVAPEQYQHPAWLVPPEVDGVVPGVVLDVAPSHARIRVGDEVLELDREGAAWTRERDLTRILRRGDLAPFRIGERDDAGVPTSVELEQSPELEAALVAIDVASGEVVAMVGGYDYQRSEYNKASQALRQVGSAFKPLYYAVALEEGLLPTTTIIDEPTVFVDAWTGQGYTPRNYHHEIGGRVTLREALERSLNIASVRLLNAVGYERVIDHARRSGITADLQPYPSLALGAQEITLLEITSAYAVFPNMGLRVEPTLIRRVRDARGEVLRRSLPAVEEVLSPATAFQMCHLLRGVVQHGTGRRARSLGRPVAGKTGTTDDYSDAWFVGFTPSLAIGVWVGHERELRPIGRGYAGAKAALPIWIDFVQASFGDGPVEQFVNPGGVEFVAVDRKTGLRATSDCPPADVFLEAFRTENKPRRNCTVGHHAQRRLPVCLQRFPLDTNGVLVVDERTLLQLEEESSSCGIFVDPIQRTVTLPWSAGAVATAEGGTAPLAIPYRPRHEVFGVRWTDNSLEELLLRDPRQVRGSRHGGIADFEVLDGRTVMIIRNDG